MTTTMASGSALANSGHPAGQVPEPTGQETGTHRITLTSQTPWVRAGTQLELGLHVRTPLPADELEVVLLAYPRIASRSGFQLTMRDQNLGSVKALTSFPLSAWITDTGHFVLPVPIDDRRRLGAVEQMLLLPREAGVYPLRVELQERGGNVLDGFTTHLVNIPVDPIGPRLGVVPVVPLHQPPALQPDGARRPGLSEALAATTQVLDGHPSAPTVVAATPETLESLAANPDPASAAVLSSLRRADRRQVVSGSYVPVSLSALVTAGLRVEANAQVRQGRDVAAEVLRVPAGTTSWLAERPIDNATVRGLEDNGVSRLVLPESTMPPSGLPVTLTRPFLLAVPGERASDQPIGLEAVASDDQLTAHFGDDEPALRVQQLLADLAVLYFDQPATQRGVVAVPPLTWKPSAAFLHPLLTGLESTPLFEAMTLDTLFHTVEPARDERGVPLLRRLAPPVRPSHELDDVAPALRTTRRDLFGFDKLLDQTNPLRGTLNERLLIAQSTDLRTDAERARYIEGVRKDIDGQRNAIRVPRGRTITLTARKGEIPVTFQNRTGFPVHAVVTLGSDKLRLPRLRRVIQPLELTRPNTTVRFPVVAPTSGVLPLSILLESPPSPDGTLRVASTIFTVRSTAASGVGLALSVGAGLFLVVWWGRHLVRGRRARRLVPT